MYAIHDGVVGRGFQFASGEAVGRDVDPSPFSRGTLRLQDEHFQTRGFDLADAIPGLHWGTVNVELGVELVLASPDLTLPLVDWTAGESNPAAWIEPESFSFVRCCLAHDGISTRAISIIRTRRPSLRPTRIAIMCWRCSPTVSTDWRMASRHRSSVGRMRSL